MYGAQESTQRSCDNHKLRQTPQLCHQVCNIDVERLVWQDAHQAWRRNGPSALNYILMCLNLYEPCTTATNQHCCLQIGRYLDLERYTIQIVPICRVLRSAILCIFTSSVTRANALTVFCFDVIATGREGQRMIFCRDEYITRIKRSMKDVLSSTFTARFLFTPNRVHKRMPAMPAKSSTISPTDST